MIKVQANSDLRVAVNGRRWVYNPRCLSLAPGEIPLEETAGKHSVYHIVVGHSHFLVLNLLHLSFVFYADITQSDNSHFLWGPGRICFQDFMWMCVGLQNIPLRK